MMIAWFKFFFELLHFFTEFAEKITTITKGMNTINTAYKCTYGSNQKITQCEMASGSYIVGEYQIDCTGFKQDFCTVSDKLDTCKEKGVDVFIDDSLFNCNKISEAGIKTFVMDTIINRGEEGPLVTRVYSWPHVYMKLNELNK